METLESLIATHPFVQDMEPSFIELLSGGAMVVEFARDEVIAREGDYADKFYLIHRGKVLLECHTPERDVKIETLSDGDVLGWSWMFPPFASHFQARAVEPTIAVQLNGAHLLILSEENARFGHKLMKRVAELVIHRLQQTRQRLIEVSRKSEIELGSVVTP